MGRVNETTMPPLTKPGLDLTGPGAQPTHLRDDAGHALTLDTRESDAEWVAENSVGDALMDSHHHGFFELVARMEDAPEADALQVVREQLAFLIQYVDLHFGAEEALMQRVEFVGFEAHRRAHQVFRERLEVVHGRLGDRVTASEAQSLRNSIRYWWITHIQREDAQYAPLLRARR